VQYKVALDVSASFYFYIFFNIIKIGGDIGNIPVEPPWDPPLTHHPCRYTTLEL
jgi:hypothetical protein